MNKPSGRISRVEDIQVSYPHPDSPWESKSGGILRVNFAVPLPEVTERFIAYEGNELTVVSTDIRGLRLYRVSDMPEGAKGGGEYHEVRQELVGVNRGRIAWVCEDLLGGKKVFKLDAKTGISIWMPPFILHTYTVLESGSELWFFANTLSDPRDKASQDTYPKSAFRELQAEYAKQPK